MRVTTELFGAAFLHFWRCFLFVSQVTFGRASFIIWGWSLVGLAISAAFAFGLWHAVVSGHVRTNHGEFYRHLRPFAFWVTVVICFALYLVSVATMFVAQPFATR